MFRVGTRRREGKESFLRSVEEEMGKSLRLTEEKKERESFTSLSGGRRGLLKCCKWKAGYVTV